MSRNYPAAMNRSNRARRPLSFEHLEERCLLSRSPNLLVLDFTTPGETIPFADGGFVAASSFADEFLTTSTAQRLMRKIEQRVEFLLKRLPNPLQILIGGLDDVPGFDLGQSSLATGRASDAQLTDVIYVSGSSFLVAAPAIGLAFQASEGSNLEHYGFAFTASFNYDFLSGPVPVGVKQLFVIQVAAVIAHEYGHLLGLGHVLADPLVDTNLMNNFVPLHVRRLNDATNTFTELYDATGRSFCGAQNPFQELANSLDGSQPIVPGSDQWAYSHGRLGGPPVVVIGTPTCSAPRSAASAVDHVLSSTLEEFDTRGRLVRPAA